MGKLIKKGSTFLAWIVRMSLIKRWALMHCFRSENVSEHSHQTAVIAHMLAVIKNKMFEGNVNAERVAVLALYHEVSETKLQDLNSKTKYLNPEFTKQYKIIEHRAELECIHTLPEELREDFTPLIVQDQVDNDLKEIVKAADLLSAYIKANDELRFSNTEFTHVKEGLDKVLADYCERMPEVRYFMEKFVPQCWATVDQLAGMDADAEDDTNDTAASATQSHCDCNNSVCSSPTVTNLK